VASPGLGARRGTIKKKEFKLDTQNCCKINAINSDKAIDLRTFPGCLPRKSMQVNSATVAVFGDKLSPKVSSADRLLETKFQSLCGSEVTRKIIVGCRGGASPSAP